MTSAAITFIQSRDNSLVKDLRKLAQDSTTYRKQGRVWLEGDHLCRAALERSVRPSLAVFAESYWPQWQAHQALAAMKIVVTPDALFRDISGLESPAGMAFVWDMPAAPAVNGGAATVVLDRVQDAGNVGSILRSASAFGFRQVVALKGSAALWSGKVLRAGMGAHFALNLIEGAGEEVLDALDVPLLVTSSHAGGYLHQMDLPWPCAWVMGHEGQGVAASIEARAAHRVRIAQPGGEESLNVAAAAAICLHASGAVR